MIDSMTTDRIFALVGVILLALEVLSLPAPLCGSPAASACSLGCGHRLRLVRSPRAGRWRSLALAALAAAIYLELVLLPRSRLGKRSQHDSPRCTPPASRCWRHPRTGGRPEAEARDDAGPERLRAASRAGATRPFAQSGHAGQRRPRSACMGLDNFRLIVSKP